MITTARQLKDLIRNLSKKKSADAQILMRNYMMERFLERISLSEYKNQFILKGGMLVGGKKGCWLRCLASDENPGLWLLDMLRRAACGLPQAGGTSWQPYGKAVPDAALTPASLAAEQSASPRPKRRRLGKALAVLLLLALAALAAGWYYTGGDLAALPQKLQSLGAESLPHAGAKLV